MKETLSPTKQTYLRAIYDLTLKEEVASTSALADVLGISPASASGMVQRMATMDPPLVQYRKHHGVALSSQGRREALRILRRHRLIEMFLYEELNYSWAEVHEEADRLEHVISQLMEDRIAEKLGHPSFDPHGDPIPTRDLRMKTPDTLLLTDVQPGVKVIIRRVHEHNADLLNYFGEVGLRLGRAATVLQRSPVNGTMHLQLETQEAPLVIGMQVAEHLFVEILDEE